MSFSTGLRNIIDPYALDRVRKSGASLVIMHTYNILLCVCESVGGRASISTGFLVVGITYTGYRYLYGKTMKK